MFIIMCLFAKINNDKLNTNANLKVKQARNIQSAGDWNIYDFKAALSAFIKFKGAFYERNTLFMCDTYRES